MSRAASGEARDELQSPRGGLITVPRGLLANNALDDLRILGEFGDECFVDAALDNAVRAGLLIVKIHDAISVNAVFVGTRTWRCVAMQLIEQLVIVGEDVPQQVDKLTLFAFAQVNLLVIVRVATEACRHVAIAIVDMSSVERQIHVALDFGESRCDSLQVTNFVVAILDFNLDSPRPLQHLSQNIAFHNSSPGWSARLATALKKWRSKPLGAACSSGAFVGPISRGLCRVDAVITASKSRL